MGNSGLQAPVFFFLPPSFPSHGTRLCLSGALGFTDVLCMESG